MTNNKKSFKENENILLREIIVKYARYWYWFLFGLLLALVGAYVYLRYTTPKYLNKATVLIKEDNDAGLSGELASIVKFTSISSRLTTGKMENELAIFRSKRIISEVVKELDLNITYQSVGTIKSSSIYVYRPITVKFLSFNDAPNKVPVPKIFIEIHSNTEYTVSYNDEKVSSRQFFGDKVSLPFGDITVIPEMERLETFEKYIGNTISVNYQPIETVAMRYQRRLNVLNEVRNSNVVDISIQSTVRSEGKDFIDELVAQYNKDAIDDRNQVARNTASFIDSRLDIITRELDSVETGKETFKSTNRLTDIEAEAQLTLENASKFNQNLYNVGTQLELTNTMIAYVDTASNGDLLPANIGLDGSTVSGSVDQYNELVLQRNRFLRSSTEQNPVVVNLNNQIEQLRSGIKSSLDNAKQSLSLTMRDLNFQEAQLNSKIRKVPTQEKLYRDIERQQTIKEQLYLFLLQQREEASIALAVTAPKAKIIDSAYSSKVPISPNRSFVFSAAIMLGLIFPFLAIYLSFVLNTKILNRNDVEQILGDIPIIGEIPKLKKSDQELIGINDRSILAEAFRILRTNFQYLSSTKKNESSKSNVVFVTSTIKGEGKTFVAFNLALSLALTGKKVLLIGADIRNPQIHRYLDYSISGKLGLTEYIIDQDVSIESLPLPSKINDNLSVLISGTIPPNPAELLLSSRTQQLFDEVKELYDYVIVDTAPAMFVTDTILINKYADITLYVSRAGYTDKELLEFCKDVVGDGRLQNVASVLNGVELQNYGYGNKYGYTYASEKITFWQRVFKR